jgi:hypothetical protein
MEHFVVWNLLKDGDKGWIFSKIRNESGATKDKFKNA